MIQPKFCFTRKGYREQARNLEDADLYDCLMSYRDYLGSIRNLLVMYGMPPRWVEEFSDELLERENARNPIVTASPLEQEAVPSPQ